MPDSDNMRSPSAGHRDGRRSSRRVPVRALDTAVTRPTGLALGPVDRYLLRSQDPGPRSPAAGAGRGDVPDAAGRSRRAFVFWLVVILLAAAVAVRVGRGWERDRKRDERALSRTIADAAERARRQDPSVAARLAVLAGRIAPTQQARGALLELSGAPTSTRVSGPSSPVATALSRDGTVLAVGGSREIRVWEVDPVASRAEALGPAVSLPLRDGPVGSLALGPDGRVLAAAGGSVLLCWDLGRPADPPVPVPLPAAPAGHRVLDLEFSPDGHVLAAGTDGAGVLVWRVSGARVGDGPGPRVLAGTGRTVRSVEFSPEGTSLAAGGTLAPSTTAAGTAAGGGAAGFLDLWRVGPGRAGTAWSDDVVRVSPVVPGPGPGRVEAVAFGPAGRRLLVGTRDGPARLWYLPRVRGAGPVPAPGPPASLVLGDSPDAVTAVRISRDARLALSAGEDGRLRLYRGWDGRLLRELPHPDPVVGAVFLGDGDLVLTVARDGLLRIWPTGTGQDMPDGGQQIDAVAFGGRDTVLVAVRGRAPSVLDLGDRFRPRRIGPLTVPGRGAEFTGAADLSPDGDLVAAGTRGGDTYLWDVGSSPPRCLGRLPGAGTAPVGAVDIGPRGRWLVTGDDSGRVRIWDLSGPEGPRRIAGPWVSGPRPVTALLVTDARRYLLVGHSDPASVVAWKVTDPLRPAPVRPPVLGLGGEVLGLSVLSANEVLAVPVDAGGVRLIGALSQDQSCWFPEYLTVPGSAVVAVAAPPPEARRTSLGAPGDIMAGLGANGALWLWDLSDPRAPRPLTTAGSVAGGPSAGPGGPSPGPAATGLARGLAFSPDGQRIASVGPEGVRLQDVDPSSAATSICASTGAEITDREWRRFLPEVEQRPTC